MCTSVPTSLPTSLNNNIFASIDMCTNISNLLIVQIDPSTGHLLILDHSKKYVLLGLDFTPTISHASTRRATSVLPKFQDILLSRHVPSDHSRFVATLAIREYANKSQFINSIHEILGLHVDVLSGSDEARLIYLGILQFTIT
ncbi:phosphatase [Lithospermum erythrorhizon]|uniref:Phosphatase n=1 Tax=Lithospermum erythrorhizon TaxID=34254 RepID=A0AAV3P9M7_LITER